MHRILATLSLCLMAGLCAAMLSAAPAQAAEITLSYANFPPASTFPSVQMERWAEEVSKRTNGKVEIQTYPGSTLLGPKNMLRGVQMGQADIGCVSTSYHPGVFPFTDAVNQPVGFSSATVASVVLWELFTKYNPEEFKDLKVLTMFTSAPSNLMSKKAVRTLDDFKGLEVRASGTLNACMSLLGSVPAAMPMNETPEALQKGVVEALVTSLEVLKDFNFAELCRYETILNFPVYPFAVIMNKATWESLPKDVQEVMDSLSLEQALWTGQYMDGHVTESLEWSKEKYSIEIIHLPEDQMAEMQAKVATLIDEWKKQATDAGLDADQLLSDLYALKTKYEAEYGK